MDFLNNDLVKKVEEQYGSEAADLAEAEAAKFVGKDAAASAIGGLSASLGITRRTDSQAAQAAPPVDGAADAPEAAADSDTADA